MISKFGKQSTLLRVYLLRCRNYCKTSVRAGRWRHVIANGSEARSRRVGGVARATLSPRASREERLAGAVAGGLTNNPIWF